SSRWATKSKSSTWTAPAFSFGRFKIDSLPATKIVAGFFLRVKSKFLGAVGVCVTDLRPAGTVTVEGEPLDVVTEGGFVKAGDKVKVINVDGSRILVRQI
ncbi:MAG: hypothetical protein II902_03085, partial [Selenomonadaceae bacterium]|nr:hypothetical protein [Selenomonadaceae bacterium]